MSRLQSEFVVIDYQHIDDFRCFSPLEDYFPDPLFGTPNEEELNKKVDQLRGNLSELFLNAGWEGDGDIECYLVPPCFCNRGDTHCEAIFHVKQSNNGTSWLAIPRGFEFKMPNGFLSRG